MDSLQDEGHMSPFLGGISHSLRSHVTLPQVLHDIQQSGCEGDSRRTIHDKTTTKKFLRVGGGEGLMKHLKFKTGDILLEGGSIQ